MLAEQRRFFMNSEYRQQGSGQQERPDTQREERSSFASQKLPHHRPRGKPNIASTGGNSNQCPVLLPPVGSHTERRQRPGKSHVQSHTNATDHQNRTQRYMRGWHKHTNRQITCAGHINIKGSLTLKRYPA